MAKIFVEGELSKFVSRTITDSYGGYRSEFMRRSALESVVERSTNFSFSPDKTHVFISHKHSELRDLETIIDILENKYHVECYIDSRDPFLPKKPSGVTAKRIKDIILKCDKFILLATNGAVTSPWCNWELGLSDGEKDLDNVAILPIRYERDSEQAYKGHEYMDMYSTISESYSGVSAYGYTTTNPRPFLIVECKRRGRMLLQNWLRS